MERTLFLPASVSFSQRIKDTGERAEITGVASRADWDMRPGCWPVLLSHPPAPQRPQWQAALKDRGPWCSTCRN